MEVRWAAVDVSGGRSGREVIFGVVIAGEVEVLVNSCGGLVLVVEPDQAAVIEVVASTLDGSGVGAEVTERAVA